VHSSLGRIIERSHIGIIPIITMKKSVILSPQNRTIAPFILKPGLQSAADPLIYFGILFKIFEKNMFTISFFPHYDLKMFTHQQL